jgi:hypothetical protein
MQLFSNKKHCTLGLLPCIAQDHRDTRPPDEETNGDNCFRAPISDHLMMNKRIWIFAVQNKTMRRADAIKRLS